MLPSKGKVLSSSSFSLLIRWLRHIFTCCSLKLCSICLQMILQANPRVKHFNIFRKPLPLEPSLLLREANRRRASLSVGNVSELLDIHHNDG